MAGMVLADFGADVIRVDRPNNPAVRISNNDILARGKRSLAVDTKVCMGRAFPPNSAFSCAHTDRCRLQAGWR